MCVCVYVSICVCVCLCVCLCVSLIERDCEERQKKLCVYSEGELGFVLQGV